MGFRCVSVDGWMVGCCCGTKRRCCRVVVAGIGGGIHVLFMHREQQDVDCELVGPVGRYGRYICDIRYRTTPAEHNGRDIPYSSSRPSEIPVCLPARYLDGFAGEVRGSCACPYTCLNSVVMED
jgi:hypothetical protein